MSILIYLFSILLFLIGLYCIVSKENLLKIVIGIKIMGYGVSLFFILLGWRRDSSAPIIIKDMAQNFVDPLPQALIPAIMVISLAATILMLATCVRLYEKYGTFDISKIKELKG
ncbi:MAG: NADH-quinone oxidoreductase subunit K [Elusimicrobia bacterium]|nr:NADH-quinone oxidoreductase subunit K [Elusimicrobiota bacterium]